MARLGESIVLSKILAANSVIYIPTGYAIEEIYFANTTANAVTGGVRIGTSGGAADVVAAQAVGASAIGHVTDATILKRLFARRLSAIDTPTSLFVEAVTAWNSASVMLRMVLTKVI